MEIKHVPQKYKELVGLMVQRVGEESSLHANVASLRAVED